MVRITLVHDDHQRRDVEHPRSSVTSQNDVQVIIDFERNLKTVLIQGSGRFRFDGFNETDHISKSRPYPMTWSIQIEASLGAMTFKS